VSGLGMCYAALSLGREKQGVVTVIKGDRRCVTVAAQARTSVEGRVERKEEGSSYEDQRSRGNSLI